MTNSVCTRTQAAFLKNIPTRLGLEQKKRISIYKLMLNLANGVMEIENVSEVFSVFISLHFLLTR